MTERGFEEIEVAPKVTERGFEEIEVAPKVTERVQLKYCPIKIIANSQSFLKKVLTK